MTRHSPSRRDMLLAALTGLFAAIPARAQQSQGPGDNGIGGTGLPRRAGDGIGGTGVHGAISGFGSIIVNGARISYAPDAVVHADGRRLRASALRIGHVVRVGASGSGAALAARWIELDRIVIGPVTAVGWLSREIRVLGQRVIPPSGGERPGVGTWIAVSGFRRADGVIEASLIEPTEERVARVTGTLDRLADGAGLGIGGLTVDAPARRAGQRVRVSGDVENGRLVAPRIASAPGAPEGRRILVQGFATRSGDRMVFADGGLAVRLPGGVAWASSDAKVVVHAERGADHSWIAVTVSDSGGLGGEIGSSAARAPAGRGGAA
ncbi:MAG TPA: hypothetical protein PK812_09415, partial [Beijerinckiaceae bacterium]|nr:hypothetical protein [Beijerinckiaceae bacterium]